jgi:hypothetical protein
VTIKPWSPSDGPISGIFNRHPGKAEEYLITPQPAVSGQLDLISLALASATTSGITGVEIIHPGDLGFRAFFSHQPDTIDDVREHASVNFYADGRLVVSEDPGRSGSIPRGELWLGRQIVPYSAAVGTLFGSESCTLHALDGAIRALEPRLRETMKASGGRGLFEMKETREDRIGYERTSGARSIRRHIRECGRITAAACAASGDRPEVAEPWSSYELNGRWRDVRGIAKSATSNLRSAAIEAGLRPDRRPNLTRVWR